MAAAMMGVSKQALINLEKATRSRSGWGIRWQVTEAEITPFDWAQLGKEAGLRPAAMARQMTGLIDKVTEVLAAAGQAAALGGVGGDTVAAVTRHIEYACDRYRAAATQVQGIKPD